MKLEPYFIPFTKIYSKKIKDLNIRPDTLKFVEEKKKRNSSLKLVLTVTFWRHHQKHKQKRKKINLS